MSNGVGIVERKTMKLEDAILITTGLRTIAPTLN